MGGRLSDVLLIKWDDDCWRLSLSEIINIRSQMLIKSDLEEGGGSCAEEVFGRI
jgi:hypothetical protein